MALENEEMTGSILGAAVAVHRVLGPGFLESVYAAALSLELGERQIEHRRELSVPIVYRDVVVATHRIDLLVHRSIIVELKATKEITDVHYSVVRSYLKAIGQRHGLILNFAKPTLEAKRVLAPASPLVPAFLPSSAANRSDPECQNCAYRYSDCDAGGPGPFPDTGIVPIPSCSPACYARHDANIGICGPLAPPDLPTRATSHRVASARPKARPHPEPRRGHLGGETPIVPAFLPSSATPASELPHS